MARRRRSAESPPVPFSQQPDPRPGNPVDLPAQRAQAVDRQIRDAITEHDDEEFHED